MYFESFTISVQYWWQQHCGSLKAQGGGRGECQRKQKTTETEKLSFAHPTRGERYYRSGIISRILALFGKYRISRYQGNLVRFYTIFLV